MLHLQRTDDVCKRSTFVKNSEDEAQPHLNMTVKYGKIKNVKKAVC